MIRINHPGPLLPILLATGILACQPAPDEKAPPTASSQTDEKDAHQEEGHDDEAGTVDLTEAQFKTAGIQLGRIEQKSLSGLIRVNGSMAVPPQQLISVSTPYGGILTSTPLLPGQTVRKGQTLATLENPEFIRLQQEYLETQSQLTYQEQEYERQRELSRENVTAQKTFQQATAQLGTSKARAEGLKQQLALLGVSMSQLQRGTIVRQLPVRSPIAGTVTDVRVNRGRYVAANDVLFELVGSGALYAELIVFENDIPNVKIGQRVRLSGVAGSAEQSGRIRLINRETRPDRTVRVYASLDQSRPDLSRPDLSRPDLSRPGTYLTARIETGSAPQAALPENAIVQHGTQTQIFVFEEKEQHNGQTSYRFRPVPVVAGVTEGGYRAVQFSEPFRAGTQIVVSGAYDLLSALNNSEEEGHHH